MKVKNGKELSAALLKIKSIVEKDYEEILQQLSFESWNELVTRTARRTGFARSNWEIIFSGSAPDNFYKNPNPKSGNFPEPFLMSLKGIHSGSKITIFNNTIYIKYLEDGTPYTRAQPMIEPTYQMLYNKAEFLANKLSRKRVA